SAARGLDRARRTRGVPRVAAKEEERRIAMMTTTAGSDDPFQLDGGGAPELLMCERLAHPFVNPISRSRSCRNSCAMIGVGKRSGCCASMQVGRVRIKTSGLKWRKKGIEWR